MQRWDLALRKIQSRKGVAPFLIHALLKVPSFCFESGVKFRNLAYDNGWKKSGKVSIPVISIGNIVAGGTGKTPFTLFLADALSSHFRIAILTRGYRSKAEKGNHPIVVKPDDNPEDVGDEALLFAKHLKNGFVISGKERLKSAKKAEELGATLILLDDGMQHRKIHRDIEIILVDNPPHEDDFLPAGYLRDEPKRLSSADLIVEMGHHEFSSSPSTMGATFYPKEIVLEDGTTMAHLDNQKVALFCGIAKPHKFIETVKSMQGHIVAQHILADHGTIKTSELIQFAHHAKEKGAHLLLCTEKDWIKMKHPFCTPLTMGWVKRELVITKNPSLWDGLIEKIVQWS